MKIKLTSAFYFRYVWNTGRKNCFIKLLVTVVCAFAVALSAMAIGQFSNYLGKLDEYMKNVSDRELVVFNNVFAGNQFDTMNFPIASDRIDAIKNISGVHLVKPLFLFSSNANAYSRRYYASEIATEYDLQNSRVLCSNAAGLKKEVWFDPNGTTDFENGYHVLSYPEESAVERAALYRDSSAEDGVYITERFMERLGLTPDDLSGLTIAFDAWVYTAQREETMLITDYHNDGTTEEYEMPASMPFSQKLTLTRRVKGVLPEAYYDQASKACIYMSSDQMAEILKNCPKDYEAMKYITEYLRELNPDKVVEDFSERFPNSYYVIVDSAEEIKTIKAEIEALDPNFKVLHEYQDVESAHQTLSDNRRLAIYITFAILMIVLLLMALIYIGLIGKRQFEFAVLRANGMTKREIHKVICTEMLLQLLEIFVLSIGFAFLIYCVGIRWYTLQFDWMTILWLTIISLGAIILPTVISLFFVNKFEPDAVMRN